LRIPLIRFGGGPGDSTIAWWEWLFAPLVYAVVIPLFLLVGLLSVPYSLVYPDAPLHGEEALGTARQRELLARWRASYSRLSFWQRVRRAAKVWRRQRRQNVRLTKRCSRRRPHQSHSGLQVPEGRRC
jgi:hypothetical protein